MRITSSVLSNEKSSDWELFLTLVDDKSLKAKGIQLIPLVVKSKNDIYKIPSARARYEASVYGAKCFPIVTVDGSIVARRRLLKASEYESLIDGLSLQWRNE